MTSKCHVDIFKALSLTDILKKMKFWKYYVPMVTLSNRFFKIPSKHVENNRMKSKKDQFNTLSQ